MRPNPFLTGIARLFVRLADTDELEVIWDYPNECNEVRLLHNTDHIPQHPNDGEVYIFTRPQRSFPFPKEIAWNHLNHFTLFAVYGEEFASEPTAVKSVEYDLRPVAAITYSFERAEVPIMVLEIKTPPNPYAMSSTSMRQVSLPILELYVRKKSPIIVKTEASLLQIFPQTSVTLPRILRQEINIDAVMKELPIYARLFLKDDDDRARYILKANSTAEDMVIGVKKAGLISIHSPGWLSKLTGSDPRGTAPSTYSQRVHSGELTMIGLLRELDSEDLLDKQKREIFEKCPWKRDQLFTGLLSGDSFVASIASNLILDKTEGDKPLLDELGVRLSQQLAAPEHHVNAISIIIEQILMPLSMKLDTRKYATDQLTKIIETTGISSSILQVAVPMWMRLLGDWQKNLPRLLQTNSGESILKAIYSSSRSEVLPFIEAVIRRQNYPREVRLVALELVAGENVQNRDIDRILVEVTRAEPSTEVGSTALTALFTRLNQVNGKSETSLHILHWIKELAEANSTRSSFVLQILQGVHSWLSVHKPSVYGKLTQNRLNSAPLVDTFELEQYQQVNALLETVLSSEQVIDIDSLRIGLGLVELSGNPSQLTFLRNLSLSFGEPSEHIYLALYSAIMGSRPDDQYFPEEIDWLCSEALREHRVPRTKKSAIRALSAVSVTNPDLLAKIRQVAAQDEDARFALIEAHLLWEELSLNQIVVTMRDSESQRKLILRRWNELPNPYLLSEIFQLVKSRLMSSKDAIDALPNVYREATPLLLAYDEQQILQSSIDGLRAELNSALSKWEVTSVEELQQRAVSMEKDIQGVVDGIMLLEAAQTDTHSQVSDAATATSALSVPAVADLENLEQELAKQSTDERKRLRSMRQLPDDTPNKAELVADAERQFKITNGRYEEIGQQLAAARAQIEEMGGNLETQVEVQTPSYLPDLRAQIAQERANLSAANAQLREIQQDSANANKLQSTLQNQIDSLNQQLEANETRAKSFMNTYLSDEFRRQLTQEIDQRRLQQSMRLIEYRRVLAGKDS
ncbi:MAG: hypothetical protein IPO91_28885 [Chloroflexi bacterium]|nr:hypothetical protein [Chloroflexota bacterium]